MNSDNSCPSDMTLVIALNNDQNDHPLTTEEPLGSSELAEEFEEINQVDANDIQVPPAEILAKIDPNLIIPGNRSDDEPSLLDQEVTESPNITSHATAATTETTTTTASGNISPIHEHDNDESDETDDELIRITEANRFIPPPNKGDEPITKTVTKQQQHPRSKSLRSQSVSTRRHLLVFSNHVKEIKKSDRIIIHHHYGAGPDGQLTNDLKPIRRKRAYLVACDFSQESFHAIEWTMGTMMRDSDQLYVVTAVNREDNPEAVKQTGLSLSKELQKASDTVTEEAKKTLGQMLLFDIELITYAICGKVKDVLFNLIEELPLTMVICGSRGRSTVKGMLMGSISTYLVHKSPVPVTVIRPQKKKKAAQKKLVRPGALSQSVKTGQLAVDEVSKTSSTTTPTDPPTPPVAPITEAAPPVTDTTTTTT